MKSPIVVLIIGAGVGGIAAAAHLAQRGMSVTVIEKNTRPGGRCDHFSREGHCFDTGPTLMIFPHLYEAEFGALGASMQEMLQPQRIDPTYHLVFDDGRQLALTSDQTWMRDQLEAFEPGSFRGFQRYMAEAKRHYDLSMSRLVYHDFRTATDFFSPRNLPLVFGVDALIPHYRHMSAFFDDPHLKAAFTFEDVYMGLSPFEAPATFSMMPYTELVHGVWYPKGGMYRVVEALMDIARRAGVKFLFNTPVRQIDVKGDRARAVILEDGRHLEAEVVIANADLPYVYQELLPDHALAENVTHKRFSCSAISFFWGIDKTYPELGPHTLFLADDYRGDFERIDHHMSLPDKPSLYVHAPARLDSVHAPQGQDTLIAVIPVSHLDPKLDQEWAAMRDQARLAVFHRLETLGISDLPNHIKFEVVYTPLSWHKRYNLLKGATHGLSHTLTQMAYLRPHSQHPRYHNLYFVGASTHPGTGVPTALVSAHLVAERVMAQF